MAAYNTVVVGTDGSESSLAAVDRAAALAADAATTLVVVCAYYPASRQDVEQAEHELGDETYQVVGSTPAEETLRTAQERAVKAGVGSVETVPTVGEAVSSLLRVAAERDAELLVVGNRGLNTLAGRILGSVPSEVARKSELDVLIVHTT